MPTNPPSARQPGEAPSECDFCGGDDFTPPSAHAFDRGNVYCIRCGGLHGRNYAPGVAEVVAFSDAAQRASGPPAAREPEPVKPGWEQLRAEKPAIPYLLYFPSMRKVAREHGYTLAIHGSLSRDFDLIAVAWTPEASDAETLVNAICADNELIVTVPDDHTKPHGRRTWTMQGIAGVSHGWVDLSVIEPRPADRTAEYTALLRKATTRLEILRDRMAACDDECLSDRHELSRFEIEGWIEEQRAALATEAPHG